MSSKVRVSRKEVVIIIAAVAVAMVVVLYLAGVFRFRNLENRLSTELDELANIIDVNFLLKNSQLSARLARTSKIMEFCLSSSGKRKQITDLLNGAGMGGGAEWVYILDLAGNVIATTNLNPNINILGKNYAFRPYYKEAIAGRAVVYPAVGVTTRKRGIYFSHPILHEEKVIGVIVVMQDVEKLDARLNYYHLKYSVISADGVVFASNSKKLLYKTVFDITDEKRRKIEASRQFSDFNLEPAGIVIKRDVDPSGFGQVCTATKNMLIQGWQLGAYAAYSYPFGYAITACFLVAFVGLGAFLWRNSIMQRRWAECTESRERRQAQLFLDTAATILLVLDPEGKVILINRFGCKLLGGTQEQIIGSNWYDRFIPIENRILDTPNSFKDILRNEGNGFVSYEREIITLSGDRKLILWQSSIVRDDAGEVVGLVASGSDITQKRKYETELQQARLVLENSNRNFKTILNNAPFGVLVTSSDNTIQWVNRTALNLIGIEQREKLIGRQYGDFLVEEVQNDYQVFNQLREPGKLDQILRRQDGSELSILKAVTPILMDGKDVIMQTFIDVTEEKHLAAELQHAQKMEAVGQLAAGIAHEINTPVQFVGDNLHFLEDSCKGFINLCNDYLGLLSKTHNGKKVSDDELKQYDETVSHFDLEFFKEEVPLAITQSLDGVKRIARIVRAMKEFSHPGVTGMSMADINHAIETTVTVARNEWKYAAAMNLELDPELPQIPCLVGEFNQVILNLIINARDSIIDVVGQNSGTKGNITIKTGFDEKYIEIRLTDTGGGIPKNVRDRIFDPFFTTKEVGRGSGQGLPICRHIIVDKHGGKLTYETKTGCGTTFIIKLPINRVNKDELAECREDLNGK